MKTFLRIVLFLFCILLAAAGWGYYKYKDILQPVDGSGNGKAKVVEIVSGDTAFSIGEKLEHEGLIRSALAFRLLVRYTEKGDALQAGYYRISSADTPQEILDKITSGQVLTRKITFPEGLLIHQMAAVIDKNKLCDSAEFIELASKHGKKYGDFPDNLLGYLLPDTYEVPWVCSADELLRIVTGRFNELARPEVDGTSPLGLSQTIVLASLIEREAQVAGERPVIAGVFINRLKIGMLLQCDATIQFALGKQKEYLLYSDLDIDSPYNTYKHAGLPPGPICNPGLAAIKAAAHPQKNKYLFYVRNDIKNDGSHVFTCSESEHIRAVNKYLR